MNNQKRKISIIVITVWCFYVAVNFLIISLGTIGVYYWGKTDRLAAEATLSKLSLVQADLDQNVALDSTTRLQWQNSIDDLRAKVTSPAQSFRAFFALIVFNGFVLFNALTFVLAGKSLWHLKRKGRGLLMKATVFLPFSILFWDVSLYLSSGFWTEIALRYSDLTHQIYHAAEPYTSSSAFEVYFGSGMLTALLAGIIFYLIGCVICLLYLNRPNVKEQFGV